VRADERKFVRACVGEHAWACVQGHMYVGESECRCIHAVNECEFRACQIEKENVNLCVYTLASCVCVRARGHECLCV
jgi:metal-responsive CopG/Arc/MetJ family transcriptional regulator